MWALDYLFHFLHLAVIVINTTFWWFPRTLRIAQAVLILTFLSWFVLGMFYGFGYCVLTDWHWQIKEALGESDLPYSYIKYILDGVTGRDWPADKVDAGASAVMLVSVAGCLVQTYRRHRRRPPGAPQAVARNVWRFLTEFGPAMGSNRNQSEKNSP